MAGGAEGRGHFVVLALFAIIVFILGGASRTDILPLLVLRPLSIGACGWALWTMAPGQFRDHRGLWLLAGAAIAIVAIQLVPLPPSIWQQLPGRALIVEADRSSGLSDVWRPISVTPDLTWNALFALTTPLAALLMVMGLSGGWSGRLCWVLIALGLASGLLGVLQLTGMVDDSLPYYNASGNAGAAVGLFANRNHSAAFLACLFPVLAAFAGGGRRHRQLVAVAVAIILVPLIAATGSRAGFLLGGIGLVLATILLLDDRRRHAAIGAKSGRAWVAPAVGIAILLAIATAALLARAEVVDRLLTSGGAGEKRLVAWPIVVRLATDYLPFGSGFGSFDTVFRANEPLGLLSPTYFNHAHNDWLELWLTGGLPAIVLLGGAIVAGVLASRAVWMRGAGRGSAGRLARAGSAVLLMLALASTVDYPLRTPSLSLFAAIAVAWLAIGRRRSSGDAEDLRGRSGTGRDF